MSQIMNNMRLAIGVPIGSEYIPWRFMASLNELQKPSVTGFIYRQGSLVDVNRNEIVKLMLNHPAKFTHLCFVDSDMVFSSDTIVKLAERNKPVVGALCYQRIAPFAAVTFDRKEVSATESKFEKTVAKPDATGLAQVAGCGTGLVLIERSVFEKIPPPWFKIEWNAAGQHRGEDLYFSELCHQHQIPIFVDTTVSAGHLTVAKVDKDPNSLGHQIVLMS